MLAIRDRLELSDIEGQIEEREEKGVMYNKGRSLYEPLKVLRETTDPDNSCEYSHIGRVNP